MRGLLIWLTALLVLWGESSPLASDHNESDVNASAPHERLIFTKNLELPETVYKNQIVLVHIDAIIAEDIFDTINTEFLDFYGIEVLTDKPVWYLKELNTFTLSYYIKITANYFKLPDLGISVTLDGRVLDRIVEPGTKLRAKDVKDNDHYSGVVANTLKLTNHKIDKYDDENNIFVLELEGESANLEAFSLPFVTEEGLDWVKSEVPHSKAFYYGILPNKTERIFFNYFQPETGNFQRIDVVFDFSKFGQKTSTQIEINPNKKSFPYLKVMLLVALILLFAMLYFWRRHYGYLVVALIIAAWTVYDLRDKTVRIKPGSAVYLLPTKNSSVFFETDRVVETEMIKKRHGYYKILLPDNTIGWVKEENAF